MDHRSGGEDLRQRAFLFACRIIRLCRYLERSSVGRHLTGQLLRSGTSSGANLEEARAGQSRKDFISKTNIALKEARETLYWLRLAEAAQAVPARRIEPLLTEANEIVAILTSIERRSRHSGPDRTSEQ